MTTTLSPIRIAGIPPIEAVPNAMQQLRDGMANAVAEVGIPELREALRENDRLGEDWIEHPGVMAFEEIVTAATAEIASEVARILRAAIERRLPWTWEPER